MLFVCTEWQSQVGFDQTMNKAKLSKLVHSLSNTIWLTLSLLKRSAPASNNAEITPAWPRELAE
jgi:hypothetical protein